MSKPDKALLWARKHKSVSPSMHATLAHGYRAGQAASSERIKALEAELAAIPSGKLCVCNAASDGNIPDREHEEADQ